MRRPDTRAFLWGKDRVHGSAGFLLTPEYYEYLQGLHPFDRADELVDLHRDMLGHRFTFSDYNVHFPSLQDLHDLYTNQRTLHAPHGANPRRWMLSNDPINPFNHPNHHYF